MTKFERVTTRAEGLCVADEMINQLAAEPERSPERDLYTFSDGSRLEITGTIGGDVRDAVITFREVPAISDRNDPQAIC